MIEKIKDFLIQNGYSGNGLDEYLRETSIDRRYKAFWLSATTGKTSGIIKYRGISYYFYCIKPWAYCPDGLCEVEISH